MMMEKSMTLEETTISTQSMLNKHHILYLGPLSLIFSFNQHLLQIIHGLNLNTKVAMELTKMTGLERL